MQYHLDTIPVWEVMEKSAECPLCALHRKVEADEVERSLGGSVMEPDARIRINKTGICREHNAQLFALQNRLGHALLIDSHSKEKLAQLDALVGALEGGKPRSLFGGKSDSATDRAISALKDMNEGCVLCENIDTHMQRYLHTFTHLFKTEQKFRDRWNASKGVCAPHAVELLEASRKSMSDSQQREFAASVVGLLRKSLTESEKELEWFTLKFDYRNQDKPWGNSKTALERTINRLRGWCVGEPPWQKEK